MADACAVHEPLTTVFTLVLFFTACLGAPSFRQLVPNYGLSTGKTPLRIDGTGFLPPPQQFAFCVFFVAGQLISNVTATYNDSENLSCQTPPAPSSNVTLVYINLTVAESGQMILLTSPPLTFQYYDAPVVSELVPNIGSQAGGYPVLLFGTGLNEYPRILLAFGGSDHPSACEEVNSTTIRCAAPASDRIGAVNLNISLNAGVDFSLISPTFTFKSSAPPWYLNGVTPYLLFPALGAGMIFLIIACIVYYYMRRRSANVEQRLLDEMQQQAEEHQNATFQSMFSTTPYLTFKEEPGGASDTLDPPDTSSPIPKEQTPQHLSDMSASDFLASRLPRLVQLAGDLHVPPEWRRHYCRALASLVPRCSQAVRKQLLQRGALEVLAAAIRPADSSIPLPARSVASLAIPPNFTKEDVVMDLRNAPLGRGGFGVVFSGTLKATGEKVAVKRLRIEDATELYRELPYLWLLNHPNIVPYFGYFAQPLDCFHVFALASAGSLLHYLRCSSKNEGTQLKRLLTFEESLQIAIGIAHALVFLHDHLVVHRDLKPANVLLTDQMVPWICDFSVTRTETTYSRTVSTGTDWYAAPELHPTIRRTAAYSLKVSSDVYSFGYLMWELQNGCTLPKAFEDLNNGGLSFEDHLRLCVDNNRFPLPILQAGPQSKTVMDCWHPDPSQRVDMHTVLQNLLAIRVK